MANQNLTPRQLTVGALRQLLSGAPDDAVVGLALPPSTPRSDDFTVLLNVEATYDGGAVLQLRPSSVAPGDQQPRVDTPVRIAAAGSAQVPAARVLEGRGLSVHRERGDAGGETWCARNSALEAYAPTPLEVLGLVTLLEERGPAWQAAPAEIIEALQRFGLETR